MTLIHGFLLTFFAGVSVGFALYSLKWARTWKFENFWLVYCVVSLDIIPIALAYAVLPHLSTVYASLSSREIIMPFIFGILWGFAQLGAGICVHELGFAVSGSVLNGTGAAVGTLAPLILFHRAMMFQTSGLLIFVGVAILLVGVVLCGWSGYHREEEAKRQGRGAGFSPEQSAMTQKAQSRWTYFLFIGVALGAGVLSAFTNVALAYGGSIMEKVRAVGGAASWAPFAVWPFVLAGGSLVNVGYSIYLLSKNHTWGNYLQGAQGLKELFNPVLAACMWMGGIALYSSATTYLGVLGISVGFALYTITMILCGQLAAIFTGEWHRMTSSIYRSFAFGIACLSIAVLAIAASNYFGQ